MIRMGDRPVALRKPWTNRDIGIAVFRAVVVFVGATNVVARIAAQT